MHNNKPLFQMIMQHATLFGIAAGSWAGLLFGVLLDNALLGLWAGVAFGWMVGQMIEKKHPAEPIFQEDITQIPGQ